jgi:iron-sulfur cluster assembly accessory protein
MSSVVVTQTNAGEAVSSSPSSLRTSSPPSSVSSEEPLIVTPACFQRIQHLLQQRNKSPNSMYLRVFVDAGGCSGFQYQFDLIEDANEAVDPEQDVVLKSDSGSRLVVDQTSLQYMKGATVDYVQQMIKSAFSVTYNPQSESACGCGSSFAVKNFSSNPALD